MTDCNGPDSVYTGLQRAYVALAALVESWPWLADVSVPGRTGPTVPTQPSLVQQRIESVQFRKDRDAAVQAIRSGTTPTPHADAARPGPLVARRDVMRSVRGLTERVWASNHGGGVMVWPVTDPTQRRLRLACWYCASAGTTQVILLVGPGEPAVVGPGPCPICHGHGEVPATDPCQSCGNILACRCDVADAFMAYANTTLTAELDRVTTVALADDAARILERADRAVRRACHAAEVWVSLEPACPGCRRRDLRAEMSSPDRSRWTIRCWFQLCRCRGLNCGCGRGDLRVEGDPHVWSAAEWDSPTGLAERLGIILPGGRAAQLVKPEEPCSETATQPTSMSTELDGSTGPVADGGSFGAPGRLRHLLSTAAVAPSPGLAHAARSLAT